MHSLQSFGRRPKLCRACLDERTVKLRHPGRRRAGAGAVGKDVQMGDADILGQARGVCRHLLGLCRETGDHIGTEGKARAQAPDLLELRDAMSLVWRILLLWLGLLALFVLAGWAT